MPGFGCERLCLSRARFKVRLYPTAAQPSTLDLRASGMTVGCALMIIYELLWFLRGETNIAYLREHDVNIWNEWADENGNLGPGYGAQWRAWRTADGRTIDQISQVIEQIQTTPDSRRLIVSAWNVGE